MDNRLQNNFFLFQSNLNDNRNIHNLYIEIPYFPHARHLKGIEPLILFKR